MKEKNGNNVALCQRPTSSGPLDKKNEKRLIVDNNSTIMLLSEIE